MKSYPFLFLNILFFFLTAGADAFAAESTVFRIGPGRVIQADVIQPSAPGKATFLFMPGVNRGMLADADAIKAVTAKGYGAVTYNLSTQPFSVAKLEKDETPFFESAEPTLSDFAEETQALAKGLEKQYGLKNIVPVSISYTGAVSPGLTGFPLVIDAVPLTSSAAANPILAQYHDTLKLWELNPFLWSKAQTRAALDATYRQYWSAQVTAMIAQYNLPAGRAAQMIEGYTAMSRAVEEFDWKKKGLLGEGRHVFIIADAEFPALKRHQIEVFQDLLKTKKNALLILLEESGHIIPSQKPIAYAAVLDMIATEAPSAGVIVVTPSTGGVKRLTGAAAEKFLESEK